MNKGKRNMFIYGGIIGLIGAILMKFGNPGNMGICVACFYRDIAGALGLHRAEVVQYIRPEIIGFILGAFIMSMISKDFKSRGGSSPLIRFFLGFFLVIGALIFLGCPLRMILRLSAGDLNAITGLVGYLVGIYIGIYFLRKGYTLGRNKEQPMFSAYIMPLVAVALFILLLVKPDFIFFSQEGPGSMHAPVVMALIAGLIVGAVLQKSRICTAGAFRDVFLIKDTYYLWGLIGIFAINLIANLVLNMDKIHIGFMEQPVAHNVHLWNFLGMVLTGICSALLGGCPVRQTILAGEGDADAAITVLGITVGAAFAHNFGLASSPKGVTANGKIATIIGLIFVIALAISVTNESKKA